MANSQIVITKKQANVALGLCIDNINSFVKDTEIMLKENKFDHIIIPIQFAMEELGKAKIFVEKISNSSSDKIILSKDDGWLNHEKKVEIASELIDLPRYQKALLESLSEIIPPCFPPGFPPGAPPGFPLGFPSGFLTDVIEDEEIEELKDKAKKGHSLRLESSFVDFDKESGDPRLGKRFPKEEVVTFLQILNDGLMKIKVDYIK